MNKAIYQKEEKQKKEGFFDAFEESIKDMKTNEIDFSTWNRYYNFFVRVLYGKTPTILYSIYANELIDSKIVCKTQEEKIKYLKNIKKIENYINLMEMEQKDNYYQR